MTSSSTPGLRPTSPCSSAWTATSTPPPRTCSRRFPPPRASCPGACRSRPPSARQNPADIPIMFLALQLRHHAAVGGGRICRDPAGAAALHHRRRGPGRRVRRGQICRAHPGRSGRAGRPPDRHRRAGQCGRQRQRQPGDRRAERRHPAPPSSIPTASSTMPRNSTTRSSPTAMARRSGSRMSPRSSTAWKIPMARAGTRTKRAIALAIHRQPGSNTIGGGRRDQEGAAAVPGQPAAVGASWRWCSTAARPSAPRSTMCRHTLLIAGAAGGGGDLRLPAPRLGHHHSLAGAAHRRHRHLRRHVGCSASTSTICR